MNIGLYQSASALSALERWQDVVSQNITSSQTTGYRKRSVNFSAELRGELQTDPNGRLGREGEGQALVFPQSNKSISFTTGETQPTRRELDLAIQGEGFFEVQMPDESKAYTRSGEFRMNSDRMLITAGGQPVLSTSGSPITFLPGGGEVTISRDGTVSQGASSVGKIGVQKFADNRQLTPIAGGYFVADASVEPTAVEKPEVLQGYLEGSNVTSLREMVDMVLISRAYEANQKIITTVDQTMQKTLEALG